MIMGIVLSQGVRNGGISAHADELFVGMNANESSSASSSSSSTSSRHYGIMGRDSPKNLDVPGKGAYHRHFYEDLPPKDANVEPYNPDPGRSVLDLSHKGNSLQKRRPSSTTREKELHPLMTTLTVVARAFFGRSPLRPYDLNEMAPPHSVQTGSQVSSKNQHYTPNSQQCRQTQSKALPVTKKSKPAWYNTNQSLATNQAQDPTGTTIPPEWSSWQEQDLENMQRLYDLRTWDMYYRIMEARRKNPTLCRPVPQDHRIPQLPLQPQDEVESDIPESFYRSYHPEDHQPMSHNFTTSLTTFSPHMETAPSEHVMIFGDLE